MRRVVVVDDNQLTLPGFVQALGGSRDIELVAGLDHDAALAWDGDWGSVDVVIVDAADETRSGDQFPGVAVVRGIRRSAGDRQPLIVVVTGHYLHDGLRHRMAAAGADFYFLRSDLRSADLLVDVVLHPDRHRRGVPPVADPGVRRALGVGPTSDVESFVGWVEGQALGPALAGGLRARDQPRSRRWARIRREGAAAGGIETRNLTTGDTPLGQGAPSIRQLARLWDWAGRVRRPG
jgi:DNA-binding NarL/FixJ family response regulator